MAGFEPGSSGVGSNCCATANCSCSNFLFVSLNVTLACMPTDLPTYFDGEAALDCIVMDYCGFSSFAYI